MPLTIDCQGAWQPNSTLKNHTSLRVGGLGAYLFKPKNRQDLTSALAQIPTDMPITWIGLGSNTLIRDGGNPGVTILTQSGLNQLNIEPENSIIAEAGVSCATMARFCARNHLANAEFWAGIPGTIGGALRMNAGCFNGETWDNLISVTVIDRTGKISQRSPEAFDVSYRSINGLQKDEWFLSATFRLPRGDKITSLATIKQLLARRAATQPTGEYNCGSVFRNPPENFAAQLIESCGLKGMLMGGAMVSTKHANFISNANNASAFDIESLIEHVTNIVLGKTGISLHREVHIIGSHA